MMFRVELSAQAEKDLDAILRRLWERSPDTMRRLSARFERTITQLETNPWIGGLAFENPRFPEELHHALFGLDRKRKFRALDVIREEVVVILAIRAPGERPLKADDIDT